jgi:DNA-binding response OmpR family regulator
MPRGFLGSNRLKELSEGMKTVQVLCPDASMQSQIHSVLLEFELEGEMFDTVEVAYSALIDRPPGLLIISNRLTGTVSGLDLLHALKGKGRLKSVPIVLMGDVGEIDPILLKDLGIEEVILDPFDPQDLRLILRRFFHPKPKPKTPSQGLTLEEATPVDKVEASKVDIGVEGEVNVSTRSRLRIFRMRSVRIGVWWSSSRLKHHGVPKRSRLRKRRVLRHGAQKPPGSAPEPLSRPFP